MAQCTMTPGLNAKAFKQQNFGEIVSSTDSNAQPTPQQNLFGAGQNEPGATPNALPTNLGEGAHGHSITLFHNHEFV